MQLVVKISKTLVLLWITLCYNYNISIKSICGYKCILVNCAQYYMFTLVCYHILISEHKHENNLVFIGLCE